MSLNFRDCHAKIRYVDSQVTVETGVVVQVLLDSCSISSLYYIPGLLYNANGVLL